MNFATKLHEDLRNPEFASFYLTDALKDSEAELEHALNDLIEAHGGSTAVAAKAGISADILADTSSIQTLKAVLDVAGVTLSFGVAA